ncbi:MAG: low molecular weight protein arginine phosphatase [Anaerolineae bacterium]|nr:low molecular weight protein arginine phosphatase [Anaerolineae bacterium]
MGLILVVCTANICRSPMAAGLLRQRLAVEKIDAGHRVLSAGVWAADGKPASENAVVTMAERGINISDHRSRSLTSDEMAGADLILVMTHEHAHMIRQTWPQYAWKVHLLSEMSGKRRDVEDPYGGRIEEYRACADTLSRYIDDGLERILQSI